ncbi:hypothetical protein GCM10009554_40390 [Kribbella koreensis]|uniref:TIR domain-containing protein n=2 Tax=Kribbella TaxID=182639 RepID=A0ABP6VS40_9ACTN
MDTAGVVLTAIGTVAGLAGAYFAWLAVRPRRKAKAAQTSASSTGQGKAAAVGAKYDVFVSYAHEDLDWVLGLATQLEGAGLVVARDEVILKPGDLLVHTIEEAIRDSADSILVFSPASVASGWVQQEYAALMQRSIEAHRRFIPVVIEDVELPAFAATRYYADFRDVSDTEYERVVAKIIAALQS